MAAIRGPRKLRRYSAEFKLKAVRLSQLEGVRVRDVAEALEIHPFMLSKWRGEARAGRIKARVAERGRSRQHRALRQLARLKAQYALLKEEHELLKKSHSVQFRSKGDIFAFIQAEQDHFSIGALCQRFRVSRSGFYAWCRHAPGAHAEQDAELSVRIRAIFVASAGTYGAPRIHAALAQAGVALGRKRVARLMRAARIYRRTIGARAFFSATPNRLLQTRTTAPDQVWVGDVTYLRVHREWRYLAVVMDRHSRRVLSWAMGCKRELSLTLAALNRALLRRQPVPGLIFHSDRGTEYSAYAYRARLAAHGITQSMNRPRELTDNACMESFWHSLKAEVIHTRTFDSDPALRRAIRHFMHHYNRKRLHSALGYRSPIDYERAAA